jgi:hypothetical protein
MGRDYTGSDSMTTGGRCVVVVASNLGLFNPCLLQLAHVIEGLLHGGAGWGAGFAVVENFLKEGYGDDGADMISAWLGGVVLLVHLGSHNV